MLSPSAWQAINIVVYRLVTDVLPTPPFEHSPINTYQSLLRCLNHKDQVTSHHQPFEYPHHVVPPSIAICAPVVFENAKPQTVAASSATSWLLISVRRKLSRRYSSTVIPRPLARCERTSGVQIPVSKTPSGCTICTRIRDIPTSAAADLTSCVRAAFAAA